LLVAAVVAVLPMVLVKVVEALEVIELQQDLRLVLVQQLQ
jgi:hypothetical protein